MEQKLTNILIADGCLDDLNIIVRYFEGKANFNVVGAVSTVEDFLNAVERGGVDVVVMGLVYPGMDGFELIQKAKEKFGKLPKIIIVSGLSNNGFVGKALNLGVDYYMLKPVNLELLESRILDVLNTNTIKIKSSKTRALEEKISNIFITVGIPAHIKGYQFLREAIKLAIESPEIINSITKKLYPSIAERFQTNASKVERAIRHAIEVAWNRGKIENINNLFGIKVYNSNEKPTNGEFIALVADKMLLENTQF